MSPPAVASFPPPLTALSLLSVADAVLLHIADAFLLDHEAVNCARASRILMHALRKYKIKCAVPLKHAEALIVRSSASVGASARDRAFCIGVLQRVEVWAGNDSINFLAHLPRSVVDVHVSHFSRRMALMSWEGLPSALRSLTVTANVPQPLAGWQPPSTLTHLTVGKQWTRLRI